MNQCRSVDLRCRSRYPGCRPVEHRGRSRNPSQRQRHWNGCHRWSRAESLERPGAGHRLLGHASHSDRQGPPLRPKHQHRHDTAPADLPSEGKAPPDAASARRTPAQPV